MKGHGIDFAERFWWNSSNSKDNKPKKELYKVLSHNWKNNTNKDKNELDKKNHKEN